MCQKSPEVLPQNPPPTDTPTMDNRKLVRLAVSFATVDQYEPLVALFESENPDIMVELIGVQNMGHNARELAQQADLFSFYANLDNDENALLDIRPFIENDENFHLDDFWPGLLQTDRPQYVLPVGATYQLIYYDKMAFDDLGLAYPPMDWTLEKFLSTAQSLTIYEEGETIRWGYIPNQVRRSPLLAAQLERPLWVDNELRIDDPDVTAAIQWMSDLFTVHQVAPFLSVYRPFEAQNQFDGEADQFSFMNNGLAAMWQRSHSIYQFEHYSEQIGATTIPTARHGLTAEPIVEGFAISKGTRHADVAWELASFLSQQRPIDIVGVGFSPVPARRSVAESVGYWEQLPEAIQEATRYSAEQNTQPRFSVESDSIAGVIAALVDGNSIETAVSQALPEATVTPTITEEPIVVQDSESLPTDSTATYITFFTFPSVTAQHQRLVEQFHEAQQDIRVRLFELDRRWEAGDSASQVANADCFVSTQSIIQQAQFSDLLLPLDALLELDPATNSDDFYPVTINALTKDDQLLGLPAWVVILHWQYNRKLFDEAGIEPPDLDWDLEDFLEVAQALTLENDETTQYALVHSSVSTPMYYGLGQFDPQLFDTSQDVPNINFQNALPMILWYADLVRLYEVVPTMPRQGSFSLTYDMIIGEKVAFWPRDLISEWRPLPDDFDVGLLPIPFGPNGSGAGIADRAVGYFITATSNHKEACWQWLNYLTNSVGSVGSLAAPARITVAESAEFADTVGTPVQTLYLASLENAGDTKPDWSSRPEWMDPGFQWVVDAYADIAFDQADPNVAIAEAEVNFAQYRQCVIEQDAFDQFYIWRDCALEVDRAMRFIYGEPEAD